MPSRSRTFGEAAFQFLQPRLPFLLLVTGVLCVGLFAWRIVASIAAGDKDQPLAGIEKVENGRFLGLKVRDNTADKLMQNPYLRLAMNEGYRSADVVRRHQMDEISLQDGQHPETGQLAVMIVVKPKPHEVLRPPLESIAVRRWQPEEGKELDAATIAARQRTRSPMEEDLAEIRQVWSGNRYKDVSSLFGMMRRLFAFVVIALSLVMMAGIYRSYLYFATRSDLGADGARGDAALGKFKTARAARRAQERMDQPGF